MPQLDPSSFPTQLFWLTVSFVVLYVLMARFLLPRIQEVLESRQSRIAEDLQQSEKMKLQAEEARSAYEKALAEARAKSQAQIEETLAAVEKTTAQRHAELDAALSQKLAGAEASILAAKNDAQAKMTPVASELAAMIVEKVVHQRPRPDAISAAIQGASKQQF